MELRANGVSAASPRQGLFTSAIHPHIIDNVLLRERVEVDTLTSAPASAESEIEYQIKRTVERPCLPAVFLKIWILDIYLCLLPSMAMKDRKDGRWIVSRPEIYSVVYVVVNGRTD